ncbi:hypothetical protein METBIDRAFT_44503 [Metschnikowia bicuspidata var. bicuspidata NRRL YB-4993]|uniref:Succinate dehydrogenase [ubiquinone] cytochrome b small subunit n=1 Tax=Metschnikowia bicuspidata var. bicuspidata NRRL YB-4993 TaxID=869754 RepID=A0A1A0H739_9ASCO|nr:hypothetical protein METBIDRAFT_44503 [Metschnikowia bicuspidata var. bicuspidata NRRL YB-4993]OBA19775.1 hypothetical protein METBIDRAFT_44503 [Metschnikowia bicuspidata var. bicuspidata NRRL YB-4993]
MLTRSIIGRGLLGLTHSFSPVRALLLKPNFSKLKLREQPPGNIVGTVNEASEIPLVSPYESNYHWTYERILSFGLVPMTVFPFIMGVEYPYVDTAFCLTLLFHSHCGIKSCIIDYIPERVYGFWHKAAAKLLTLGSFMSMYGIYVIETSENGLFDLISRLWSA